MLQEPTLKCPECQSQNIGYVDGGREFFCRLCGTYWACGCKIYRYADINGLKISLTSWAVNHGFVHHEIIYCDMHRYAIQKFFLEKLSNETFSKKSSV